MALATPPPALPPRTRKARAPRRNTDDAPNAGGRANGGGAAVLAFLRKSPRPDLSKLAQQVYGDATKTTRAKNLINYQVRTGKARDNKDGTYTVLG